MKRRAANRMPIFPSIVLRTIASMLVVQWAGVMPATAQTSDDGVAATAPKLAAGLLERALAPLAQDGPATPEQISLVMPILAEPGERLGTTVRYAADGEEQWREAHPLFRVHPEFAAKGHRVDEVFAGVITGLEPGRGYRVEVRVGGADGEVVRTLRARTRSLPDAAGRPTKTIAPGTTSARIQAVLDEANPGDVILFRNGTYEVDELTLKRSGTEARPIFVRGESRDGVRIVDRTGRVLHLVRASDVVVENLTIEGSNADSGTAAKSVGIQMWSGSVPERITLRHLKILGVDQGIISAGDMKSVLVYDNTLIGNDLFERAALESNATWNDDGIRVPGAGHAVFNNTLAGFGDAMAVSQGAANTGVHFYRNRVLFTGDDAFEGDYGVRNVTFYDNRVQNSMTLASFDPMYGGPAFVFRNVAINVGRQPYKLNNTNTGLLFYNNTVVRMPGYRGGAKWGWAQPDQGAIRAWAYRNNLLWFSGDALLAFEARGNDPIDFDHNAWYPDNKVWWTKSGGSAGTIEAARARLPSTTPLFGESTRRHDHDVIAEANPFRTQIRFDEAYFVPIVPLYEPVLSERSRLKHAGIPIAGITDGFMGRQPDIGAVIEGRPAPVVGDRTP